MGCLNFKLLAFIAKNLINCHLKRNSRLVNNSYRVQFLFHLQYLLYMLLCSVIKKTLNKYV
ncbi:hypothetical protein FO497_29815 [Bacillus cereus ATCC 10876]|uniref:Transposase n=1 Tax=Bacillus thuringiensis TaxID=1428 RepID=A0AAW4I2Y3_BACTU|nr:hypothetical protein [Bacillus thuringiensis]MDR4132955.1 hypothetical protein [Bacillus cereus ATCC 10876]MDR4440109.1 hypothetical protein [Bacillus cereus]RGP98235.1 hypothetical protein D1166_19985 [Bacillus sp. ISO11]MDQ7265421.1 hypothetical protein [Bacillus thuringiensis]